MLFQCDIGTDNMNHAYIARISPLACVQSSCTNLQCLVSR
uniref:Uncharacterized protein n=1 Tax=Anguilla anguilla TaxID=7936 RepID=A0A0E9U6T3_ANGAN